MGRSKHFAEGAGTGATYYHVSPHEFAPGDTVLPRRELGRKLSNEGSTADADHVFLHDNGGEMIDGWGHIISNVTGKPAHLYEVKPHGALEKTNPWDEHTEPGAYEIRAKRATIVRKLGTRFPEGHYEGERPPFKNG